MAVYIVVPAKQVCKLCTIKHKEGHRCNRFHAIPADAVWHGTYDSSLLGDLRSEVKYQRKLHAALVRIWDRQRKKLIATHAAPAFAAYRDHLLKAHIEEKPRFTFAPRI